jgi:spore maturation protein CgeB
MRVLIVGNPLEFHVGGHLLAAARSLGWEAEVADLRDSKSSNPWINRICHHWLGKRPARLKPFGQAVVKRCGEFCPDLVISSGLAPLSVDAMREIRAMGIKLVNFLTDDPWNPSNKAAFFWDCLREYDLVANPRQANLEQLRAHGCRRVEYLPFGYNPDYHFIEQNPTSDEVKRFACEVAILGGADADRVPLARALAAANMDLALYGGYWDKYPDLKGFHRGSVFGRDLRLAVQLPRCHVCMGRMANRDGHAMRSLEFPAMGACLLVEDTEEHRVLYGRAGETVLYWQCEATLVTHAAAIIGDQELNRELRRSLYTRVVLDGKHTYADRLCSIASIIFSFTN